MELLQYDEGFEFFYISGIVTRKTSKKQGKFIQMTELTTHMPLLLMIFWLLVAAVWGYVSYGIHLENKQIIEEQPTLPTLNYFLTRLGQLQRRNLQLWGFMSALLGFLAISNLYSVMPTTQPALQPVAVAAAPKEPAAIKPEEKPLPQEAKKPDEAQPATASSVPSSNPLPYSDITEFNEKDSKQQAMLDWIKQRYENWLITYYYLEKCHQVGASDLELIRAQLHKDLADQHTDTNNAEENILLAASGSYKELYAQASCSDERSKATRASYEEYMKPLRPKTSAPAGGRKPLVVNVKPER